MGIALTIFIAPFPDLLDEQINFTKLLNGHLNVIKTIKFNLKKIHKNAIRRVFQSIHFSDSIYCKLSYSVWSRLSLYQLKL